MILDPVAAYVVKTVDAETREKVFINVCTDAQISAPNTLDASDIAMQVMKGEDWIVPIVVSTGRNDKDKAGQPCFAIDCCMHPSVVLLGFEDPNVKMLTVETCIELVEDRFNRTLSRDFKFPRLKSKGTLEKTQVNTQMPHSPPNRPLAAQPTSESKTSKIKNPKLLPSLARNSERGDAKTKIEIVKSSSEDSPFYFHVYRGKYFGQGVRPSHVIEIDGEHHDLQIRKSTAHLGVHELDMGFSPCRIDAFYISEEDTTYVMLWRSS